MPSRIDHVEDSTLGVEFTTAWNSCYPTLKLFVKRLILRFRVSSWYGQEDDIVEDVMQETVCRIIEYTRKVQCGTASPISMFDHMAIVIARNYCTDLRRRDHRLIRAFNNFSVDTSDIRNYWDDACVTETAIEEVYQQNLFLFLAQEIVKFPPKQRQVLLSDLANHMRFEQSLTALQEAFLQVGIHLQEYLQPLADDPVERRRYASLRYCAYKRVAHLTQSRQYN